MINSEIISIGDELLIGQVLNTNATWLGERLFALGVPVRHVTTVGDEMQAILGAFARAIDRSDVIVVTGGLGPTHDDITRAAACEFFHTDLVENAEVLLHVEAIFRKRGIALSPSNRDQALVPRDCTVLHNKNGTAPGMRFDREGRMLFILPGVPREMMGLFTESIAPVVSALRGGGVVSRTLNTTGIAESILFERIGSVPEVVAGDGTLAFLPSVRGVRLRITVEATSQSDADAVADRMEAFLRERIGPYLFGTGDDTLEGIVGATLRYQRKTIATAESCTGGLIADWLTNVPGSSEYFLRGYVTYTNGAKTDCLDVPLALIERVGAVSSEVARAMAEGARLHSGADIAIATTGIAGPDGGSAEKPVGLVWFGLSDAAGTTAYRGVFGNDRVTNKERFAARALDLVRRRLLGIGSE